MGTDTIQGYHDYGDLQGTRANESGILAPQAPAIPATSVPVWKQPIPPKNHALSACIVLPTYNEAQNITHTLDSIFHQQRLHQDENVKLQVLVVDDSSPDGTSRIVRAYRKRNKLVHLLLRKGKDGLGAAYIDGMTHAMRTLNPDVILEMDADGQHNPADIHRLIAQVRNGADFVIGSRYTTGGSVPKAWKFYRKLISRCANQYTKAILSTGGARDCTGGFRAIRTAVLKNVNLHGLQAKGYVFQVTLLDACVRNGAVVKEVPIAFLEREHGESKMRAKDMITGGLLLAKMRFQRFFTPATNHHHPARAGRASKTPGASARRA